LAYAALGIHNALHIAMLATTACREGRNRFFKPSRTRILLSPSERLRQLVREFHSVAYSLNNSRSVEDSKELRERIEFLIDGIDRMILYNSKETDKTPQACA
jgi:hypothetical protein